LWGVGQSSGGVSKREKKEKYARGVTPKGVGPDTKRLHQKR